MHKDQKITVILVIVFVVALIGILLIFGLLNNKKLTSETAGTSTGVSVFSSGESNASDSDSSEASESDPSITGSGKENKDPSGKMPTKPTNSSRRDPKQSGRDNPTPTRRPTPTKHPKESSPDASQGTVRATPVPTITMPPKATNTPVATVPISTSESRSWELPEVN